MTTPTITPQSTTHSKLLSQYLTPPNLLTLLHLLKNDLPNHPPNKIDAFAYKVRKGDPLHTQKPRKLGIILKPSGDVLLSGLPVEGEAVSKLDCTEWEYEGFERYFRKHPTRGDRWYVSAGKVEELEG
ncbi:hypothetical protein LTR05_004051 [Lithohypha guttulata]|uniref:Uncharacterized protein n=1 Tax=Lithohypha guttulata TaxID=1690604 RepID=A0AAN7YHB0_9EURO|nr:hypothetical protein LTR05_004051 [Lithohypha guttulata]